MVLLLACSTCPHRGFECPETLPMELGTYPIATWDREDLVSGAVTLADDGTFVIDYVDDRGRTIRVRYARR